jgi:hypothetical protein
MCTQYDMPHQAIGTQGFAHGKSTAYDQRCASTGICKYRCWMDRVEVCMTWSNAPAKGSPEIFDSDHAYRMLAGCVMLGTVLQAHLRQRMESPLGTIGHLHTTSVPHCPRPPANQICPDQIYAYHKFADPQLSAPPIKLD